VTTRPGQRRAGVRNEIFGPDLDARCAMDAIDRLLDSG
jgi:hypothetical protein